MTRSIEAIRAGVDVVLQPALRNGRWFGRPDVLRRNGMPSAVGAWSYEVFDTKLAKETRGGTILQLGLYSELLGWIQGITPEHFHVVTPDPLTPVHRYRVQDFAAYVRLIRGRMEATSLQDPALLAHENYPERVEYCEICRWDGSARRRDGTTIIYPSSPGCGCARATSSRPSGYAPWRSSGNCPSLTLHA